MILQGKKIVLIVCGGIAAYKIPYLVRILKKKGADVQVVMTEKSKDFVSSLVLSVVSKNKVYSEFQTDNEWNNHVDLALNADLIIIAPATAATLSKMASSLCDNLAIAVYLSARCPIFFAPAMDIDMYKNPYNQENIKKLQTKGDILIPPAFGELASGLEGEGRMKEPEEIIQFVENYYEDKFKINKKDKDDKFSGKRILITAGPTYEAIDPVRFIGNYSSGKMGFSLAQEAQKRGLEVILISGPTTEKLQNLQNITRIDVISAEQMYEEVFKYYNQVDIAIMCAAVADYKPKNYSDKKIKKKENEMVLELTKNRDILKTMGEKKKNQLLIGFALETDKEKENAMKKLKEKNLDMIILNSLNDEGAGFKKDTNKVTCIINNKDSKEFSLKSKEEVAKDIFTYIEKNFKKNL